MILTLRRETPYLSAAAVVQLLTWSAGFSIADVVVESGVRLAAHDFRFPSFLLSLIVAVGMLRRQIWALWLSKLGWGLMVLMVIGLSVLALVNHGNVGARLGIYPRPLALLVVVAAGFAASTIMVLCFREIFRADVASRFTRDPALPSERGFSQRVGRALVALGVVNVATNGVFSVRAQRQIANVSHGVLAKDVTYSAVSGGFGTAPRRAAAIIVWRGKMNVPNGESALALMRMGDMRGRARDTRSEYSGDRAFHVSAQLGRVTVGPRPFPIRMTGPTLVLFAEPRGSPSHWEVVDSASTTVELSRAFWDTHAAGAAAGVDIAEALADIPVFQRFVHPAG